MIQHRNDTGKWLNSMGLTEMAVEVGVARGDFARTVLKDWHGKRYWMIDPLCNQSPSIYREKQPPPETFSEWHAEIIRLQDEDARAYYLRKESPGIAEIFDEAQLDFCYLDGNHSYDAVMSDLCAWWPKVRPGGVLAGHDFKNKTDDGWFCEVEKAVIGWTSHHNLEYFVTPCTSWWIVKP